MQTDVTSELPESTDSFLALWRHLVPCDLPRPVDVLMCFGSRDRSVPRHAAALYRAGLADRVLVTGGATFPDGVTEARRFASDLELAGVPAERLVIEERSRHTGENVDLGLREMADRGVRATSLGLVSWPLAARRCAATVAAHAPQVDVWSAPSCSEPEKYRRVGRTAVRAAIGELDRLRRYAAMGMIAMVDEPAAVTAAGYRLQVAHGLAPQLLTE